MNRQNKTSFFIFKSKPHESNKKAPVRRLFVPEAFHTGNYTEIVPQTKKPAYWVIIG